MSDWLLETAARIEGISDDDMAVIEKAIPAFQQLSALYAQAEPLVAKALPLIAQIKPALDILLSVAQRRLTNDNADA